MSRVMPHRLHPRGSKYRNVRTNGFASKREARAYADLLLLEKVGRVKQIQCQVPFKLEVNGELICRYIADFMFLERDDSGSWRFVVSDAKGYRTRDYALKAKLMKAIHGIEIREL